MVSLTQPERPIRRAGLANPRSTYLNDRSSQTNPIAYADLIFGNITKCDIFADTSGSQIHVVLSVPEGVVIVQVPTDRRAWTSMIGLCHLVSGESVESDLNGASHTIAKDRLVLVPRSSVINLGWAVKTVSTMAGFATKRF
jgi:hypothetical protein